MSLTPADGADAIRSSSGPTSFGFTRGLPNRLNRGLFHPVFNQKLPGLLLRGLALL